MLKEKEILSAIEDLSKEFNENARAHGFWDDLDEMRAVLPEHLRSRFDTLVMGEKVVLMHSELSEAYEAIRKDPNAPDEKCPEFTNLEIEFADEGIRLLETCYEKKIRLGPAMMAKHAYNKTRPFKHGKRS